jgi:type VI secretion system FHA domain protein
VSDSEQGGGAPAPDDAFPPDDWYLQPGGGPPAVESISEQPPPREATPEVQPPQPPATQEELPPEAPEGGGVHGGSVPAVARPELAPLFDGLGLASAPAADVDEAAVLRATGAVVRAAVIGLVPLMTMRVQFKEQFLRMDRTRIAPTENNPLKVDLSLDAILQLLLDSGSGGYMPLPQAVEEALVDARTHVLAVSKGMQAAFDALLEHLDPARIEAEVGDKQSFLAGKRKIWDVYRERYGRVADADFHEAFGKEFARVYEEVERAGRQRTNS